MNFGLNRWCSWVFVGVVACGPSEDEPSTGSAADTGSAEGADGADGSGGAESTSDDPGVTETSQGSGSGDGGESTDDDAADASSTDSGVVTNACGTFDPNFPGDSVPPQDPDDPEIIAACTDLCELLGTIGDCAGSPEACLEECKLRSCTICPGTLAPLVECETAMFGAEACTCEATGPQCPTPAGCDELEDDTTQCGG